MTSQDFIHLQLEGKAVLWFSRRAARGVTWRAFKKTRAQAPPPVHYVSTHGARARHPYSLNSQVILLCQPSPNSVLEPPPQYRSHQCFFTPQPRRKCLVHARNQDGLNLFYNSAASPTFFLDTPGDGELAASQGRSFPTIWFLAGL